MADDYLSIIADLETAQDTIAADLAATAAELASLAATPNFTDSGDGGSQSIDVVGLRAQLTAEMKAKMETIKELNITIASMQPGISVVRIPVNRPCQL